MRSTTGQHGLTILVISFCILMGLGIGIGSYTFIYGLGYSYISDEPKVCANCHVMQKQYDAWQASSHHAVATCNDCHTPNHTIGKYLAKAINGWNHSYAFTTQNFHEPIMINNWNRQITEKACFNCHSPMWEASGVYKHQPDDQSCIRCHGSIGHR